jgi:hypothetical protein
LFLAMRFSLSRRFSNNRFGQAEDISGRAPRQGPRGSSRERMPATAAAQLDRA